MWSNVPGLYVALRCELLPIQWRSRQKSVEFIDPHFGKGSGCESRRRQNDDPPAQVSNLAESQINSWKLLEGDRLWTHACKMLFWNLIIKRSSDKGVDESRTEVLRGR